MNNRFPAVLAQPQSARVSHHAPGPKTAAVAANCRVEAACVSRSAPSPHPGTAVLGGGGQEDPCLALTAEGSPVGAAHCGPKFTGQRNTAACVSLARPGTQNTHGGGGGAAVGYSGAGPICPVSRAGNGLSMSPGWPDELRASHEAHIPLPANSPPATAQRLTGRHAGTGGRPVFRDIPAVSSLLLRSVHGSDRGARQVAPPPDRPRSTAGDGGGHGSTARAGGELGRAGGGTAPGPGRTRHNGPPRSVGRARSSSLCSPGVRDARSGALTLPTLLTPLTLATLCRCVSHQWSGHRRAAGRDGGTD